MFDHSQFRMISVGIVAEDKLPDERFIEVYPVELLPLVEGGIDSKIYEVKREGLTLNKAPYNLTLHRSITVKADWIGADNRLTSPHVKAGEQVRLYTIGNSEKYYWEVLGRDNKLRTTERVTWAFAARETGNKPLDVNDSYYFTVDTIDQHITMETSKANGEFCRYLFQVNSGDGNFTFQDDVGNTLHLDSTAKKWVITNADGTFLVLQEKNVYINAPEDFDAKIGRDSIINVGENYTLTVGGDCIENIVGEKKITAKTVVVDAEETVQIDANQTTITSDVVINGVTEINGETTINGATTISDLLTANGGIKTTTIETLAITGLTTINGDPITSYKNPSS